MFRSISFFMGILFAHTTFAGQNVGGGTDWRIKVRQAQLYAADFIMHFEVATLPRYAPQDVADFLASGENRTNLAKDIGKTPHEVGELDEELLKDHDAMTAFESAAPVKWSKIRLEQMSTSEVRRTLIHESIHHLGFRDEKFADNVAAILDGGMPESDPYFQMSIDGDTKTIATDRYLFFWKKQWCHAPGGNLGALYHLSSSTWIPVRKPRQFFPRLCRNHPQLAWLGGNQVAIFGSNDWDDPSQRLISGFILNVESGTWTAFDTGRKYSDYSGHWGAFGRSPIHKPYLFVFGNKLQIWSDVDPLHKTKSGHSYDVVSKSLTNINVTFPSSLEENWVFIKSKNAMGVALIDENHTRLINWWQYDEASEELKEIGEKPAANWQYLVDTLNQGSDPYTFGSQNYLIFTEKVSAESDSNNVRFHFMSLDSETVTGPVINQKVLFNTTGVVSAFGHILIYKSNDQQEEGTKNIQRYDANTKTWSDEVTVPFTSADSLQILPDGRVTVFLEDKKDSNEPIGLIYDFKSAPTPIINR